MNKKVVTIILIILAVIACAAISYIIAKTSTKSNSGEVTQESEDVTQSTQVENNNVEASEDNLTTNIYQNVVLNSKIGNEILSQINIPDMYSKQIFEELDKNGITDKLRIMYTFALMSTDANYTDYMRVSEDFIGNYITKEDLEKIAKTFFANTENLKHQNIFSEEIYNDETGVYVIVAKGFGGSDVEYIMPVPYKITEYNDYVEVELYKVYITRFNDYTKMDENASKDVVFYNSNRTEKSVEINDERMYTNEGRLSVINEKIENEEIEKEKLDKIKITLNKENGKYLISDYKNI